MIHIPTWTLKAIPWLACFPSQLFLFLDAYFFFFCFVLFWLHHAACGILVSPQGIKPEPPAVEAQSLDHWTTREVPPRCLFLVARCSLVSVQVWSCQYTFIFLDSPSCIRSLAQHISPFKGDLMATPLKVSWLVYKTLCIQHNLHMPPATRLPHFKIPRAQVQPHPLSSGRNWVLLSYTRPMNHTSYCAWYF